MRLMRGACAKHSPLSGEPDLLGNPVLDCSPRVCLGIRDKRTDLISIRTQQAKERKMSRSRPRPDLIQPKKKA
jgi:hypothetical protein